MKKVLSVIVNTLTILVFCILAIVIVSKINMMVNNKDYFSVFGYSVFNVATGSMEPAIKQNDVIIVDEHAKYDVDDVVTYVKDGAYITHRVISINDNSIVTKGDANNTTDSAVTKDMVIGKVIKIFSNAGVWQKILTTPSVIIMIFVTLLLFDFAFSIDSKKGKSKDKKEKKEEVKEENLDYTIGINLSDIQKKINSKLDKDE